MLVVQLFNLFIFFSFIGWIYECLFCTFKDKHWENRGFLFGPICPIYGSAVAAAIFVFGRDSFFDISYKSPIWQVFLICAVLSAVLEYLTSYVLERIFHAIWWDYSDVPLNIHGRICLPATCGFGAAGVIIVRYLLPFITSIPMDAHPYINEVVSLILMLLLGIDIAVTVASLTDLLSRMENMQVEFDRRMQSGYEIASGGPAAIAAAAKQGAINAGKELGGRRHPGKEPSGSIAGYVRNISIKDRHHLRSIRGFRSENTRGIAERITRVMREHDFRRKDNEAANKNDIDDGKVS